MSSISDYNFVDFERITPRSTRRCHRFFRFDGTESVVVLFYVEIGKFYFETFFVEIILIIFEGNFGFASRFVFIANLPKRHETRMQIYSLVS